jgi:hypothetical protein
LDVNHDRSVDITDNGIIATNWQQSGKTYSEGNISYSGAVDVTDLGIMSGHWQATLDEPASPGNISVTTTSASTIALSWPKVAGCLGYRLQWSSDGTNFEFLKNVNHAGDESLAYTVTGLKDGTKYWFRVRAYGNNKDTAYSPKVDAMTVLPVATDLKAMQVNSSGAMSSLGKRTPRTTPNSSFAATWIPVALAEAVSRRHPGVTRS